MKARKAAQPKMNSKSKFSVVKKAIMGARTAGRAVLEKASRSPAKPASPAKKNPQKKTNGLNPAQAAATALNSVKGRKSNSSEAAKTKGRLAGVHESGDDSVCREVACEGLATSGGYCRLHYIKNWKKIKRKELILKEKKLNQYIEELVSKYPDKYIEAIKQDLAHDKEFAKVIYDLDLDEGTDDYDVEGSDADAVIDTIKRDFEDEGEAF